MIIKSMLWPLAGWLILVLLGYWPTQSLTGGRGIEAMLAAQAMVVVVVYVTLIPAMRQMSRADSKTRFQIAFKAIAQRFLLTLLIAAAIAWKGNLDTTAFLIWVSITYVIMIKIETVILIRWSRSFENQS